MQQGNKNQFLEKLRELGIIPDVGGVNFKFVPNYDFIDIAWRSPNDNVQNLIDINMMPKDVGKIRIKDLH